MARERILVVEDDRAILQGVEDALAFHGFTTLHATDGRSGLELALSGDYDLLLLDLVLPRGDGLEILATLREVHPTVPVIILTARGDESDRVRGLRLGADDYVVKPFSVRELLARVEAVLRRSADRPQSVTELRFACGTVDLDRLEVRFDDGDRATLSAREGELLRYLAGRPDRVVGRHELLERVWKVNPRQVETKTVDVHVGRLRDKLRDDDPERPLIRTVRGRGYAWEGGEP
jgi:DNA-binding response OmpR family regulator